MFALDICAKREVEASVTEVDAGGSLISGMRLHGDAVDATVDLWLGYGSGERPMAAVQSMTAI